jgi:formylmethanofuran dehydrogenase subunit E
MNELQALLDKSSRSHDHLCPRQILGVRISLAGLAALGFAEPPSRKRLLVILETDGCFADGVIAATDCTVGHRTLRVEDYGKTAVAFIDTHTGRAVRVAPAMDVRQQAYACVPEESRPYFAQMEAYQMLPDEKLLTVAEVHLLTPVERIVSRPGLRTSCAVCGEEILNEREIIREGTILCRACAGPAYYRDSLSLSRFEMSLRTA